MNIYGKDMKQHINNLSCVYDKYLDVLTPQEKESLNAAMQVMDALERNDGVLILGRIKTNNKLDVENETLSQTAKQAGWKSGVMNC